MKIIQSNNTHTHDEKEKRNERKRKNVSRDEKSLAILLC